MPLRACVTADMSAQMSLPVRSAAGSLRSPSSYNRHNRVVGDLCCRFVPDIFVTLKKSHFTFQRYADSPYEGRSDRRRDVCARVGNRCRLQAKMQMSGMKASSLIRKMP
jgi:hypothetical protein